MSVWSEGYVADVEYTYGYYAEKNPLRSQFILLENAIRYPEYRTACELGFGQGISANIHAAATDVQWYGTDFAPAQTAFAKELAEKCGSGAKLYDESFDEFCIRSDLPDFDFICLHGIWSWISPDNRQSIVDFISRKLKVGGVLFISYNTQPGWADFSPLRHLMAEHSQSLGSPGRSVIDRVDDAILFVEKLVATKPAYMSANPRIEERISKMKAENRHYLAHEYFNSHWKPMHFSTTAKLLKPAKMEFACSATYSDQAAQLNLSPEQIEFLRTIPDTLFVESVRDFMVNQQFRKEYWIKGKRGLASNEYDQLSSEFRVVLCVSRKNLKIKVKGLPIDEKVHQLIYDPVLDVLADNKTRTIAEIAEEISKHKLLNLAEFKAALLVLINGEYVAFSQSDEKTRAAKVKTDALNLELLELARGGTEIRCLASPVTGGGIAIASFQQFFLIGHLKGLSKSEDLARFALSLINATGVRLSTQGRVLETTEESLLELEKQADIFFQSGLPLLEALQII